MIAKVTILYEDERGLVKNFPLHMLVCACIADSLDRGTREIDQLLDAKPQKGNSKLFEACKTKLADMREPHVFALFDSDKIHRLLGQPGDVKLSDLLNRLRSSITDPRAQVFLLERNTETVVHAAADCLERPRPEKSKNARDKLLASAAWDHSRASRDCIREKVPSFAAFVDALAPLVQAALTA